MKKLLLLSAVVFVGIVSVPVQNAYAHILVRDSSESKGAILHIIPDDDPIAGKKATLFFDMQNDINGTNKVTLNITRQSSHESVPVETALDGSLITADFTFPSQGVYLLKYQIEVDGEIYVFEQSTRISRGVAVGTVDKVRHMWAEGLLMACGVIFAVLCIVAFNRRRDILEQSRF
jgi:hypothetical protein